MVLGHASAVVTLRTYAHLWPGDDDRTRSIIDAVLSPPKDSGRTERATGGWNVQVRGLRGSGGFLGFLGGHAQRYQLAFDGKQPLTWGNVFGVIGRDWNLPDSHRTVAGQ
jgi:hypothetical protein